MTSHFKWYASDAETRPPPQASYTFPTEASKSEKMTPRIPPKNGGIFTPGGVIRLEFPAQGYVNVNNTVISFDATLSGPATGTYRFQNDIQSCISRVRIIYGGTPLEDIIDYNIIRRCMTEWTGTTQNAVMDEAGICDGIGGQMVCGGGGTAAGDAQIHGHVNVRQKFIQGKSSLIGTDALSTPANFIGSKTFGNVGDTVTNAAGAGTDRVTRRYTIQLGAGLLNQDKFLPTKWLASQFAIELTLAPASDCIYSPNSTALTSNPTYAWTNINLIPEILQFDPSYDEAFLMGLKTSGVPIKFASWHRYGFVTSGTNISIQIQEKSRSVKSIYTVQKRNASNFTSDTGACFFDSADASSLQSYQYRVGGRYMPGAPVENSQSGGAISNGAAESFVELSKCLNTLGDSRLSTNMSNLNWGLQKPASVQLENDYSFELVTVPGATGIPVLGQLECVTSTTVSSSFCGTLPSQMFAMAINLETTNGVEVSGLNAEEQVMRER